MAVVVVSVLNMKGGVGKTTICINLACSLARHHKTKVLIVDFDPQANASGGLLSFDDYEAHRKKGKVVSDIFSDLEQIVAPVSGKKRKTVTLDKMTIRAREYPSGGYIDLVPSELELSYVLERTGGSRVEDRLKLILKGKKEQYDLVLIDCGPTYSVLTNNALKASDYVLIPVKPDSFSARGIPLLLSKIDLHNAASDGDDKVNVLGIVFTMVDESLRYETGVKKEILKQHKNVFQAEIRYAHYYSRALIQRKDISEINAKKQFKTNFSEFVSEFRDRLNLV